jgi:hypothetical protein
MEGLAAVARVMAGNEKRARKFILTLWLENKCHFYIARVDWENWLRKMTKSFAMFLPDTGFPYAPVQASVLPPIQRMEPREDKSLSADT